jgi:hypothetical protein
LARAARDVAAAALPRVDLTRHAAAHPRLGAVDHVSVHPLAYVNVGGDVGAAAAPPAVAAALCARMVGALLAAHGLPIYYYGGASSQGAAEAAASAGLEHEEGDHRHDDPAAEVAAAAAAAAAPDAPSWQPRALLADLRRRMGYFSPTVRSAAAAGRDAAGPAARTTTTTTTTMWQGTPPGLASMPAPLDITASQQQQQPPPLRPPRAAPPLPPPMPPPDEPRSPRAVDPRAGVCLVGSTGGWVVNLNAPFLASTPRDVAAARRVARRVSSRGGGRFKGVQAMALEKRPVVAGVAASAAAAGGVSTEAPAPSSPPQPLFTGDYVAAERGAVVLDAPQAAVLAAGRGGAQDADAPRNTAALIVEVACNLLSPDDAPADAVAREIERLAREEGLAPAGAAYRIGAAPEELVARWEREQRGAKRRLSAARGG